jgi:hypothetical protein
VLPAGTSSMTLPRLKNLDFCAGEPGGLHRVFKSPTGSARLASSWPFMGSMVVSDSGIDFLSALVHCKCLSRFATSATQENREWSLVLRCAFAVLVLVPRVARIGSVAEVLFWFAVGAYTIVAGVGRACRHLFRRV